MKYILLLLLSNSDSFWQRVEETLTFGTDIKTGEMFKKSEAPPLGSWQQALSYKWGESYGCLYYLVPTKTTSGELHFFYAKKRCDEYMIGDRGDEVIFAQNLTVEESDEGVVFNYLEDKKIERKEIAIYNKQSEMGRIFQIQR